ncbi:glycoside hydrolase family 25 protein [Corynebacterium sp. 32222D000AT]|uniref:glycoside hydrolase family 25 protein n=1 Tax=unclassified Corynebacterium TaxID=2624378 RepID=UPI002A9A4C4D|nr:glycoside hydrolase family 25 protein [Mycobacteriaceae bacterium]MDY5829609.1 glycoside hydrolase family 25 protein [Corynebacterium sp.]
MTVTKSLKSALTAVVASALVATAAAPANAAPMSTSAPAGVDVAAHQHPGGAPIDWGQVKSDGQSFAFVKASEGEGFSNPHFAVDANAAAASGLKVGAYHYGRPNTDAKTQAAHFASQLALVADQSLPPVLDIEVTDGKNPQQMQAWVREFTDELKRLTGRTPMIYTYKYFWEVEMGNTTQFAEYPLWLAAYQDAAPQPVGGWDKLSFWQRSGSGKVAGIPTQVDMNLFNGTHAQLDSFSAGNYVDFGGVLEDLVVTGAPDLGKDSTALVAAILAIAAGVAAAPQLAEAAGEAGIDRDAAEGLIGYVEKLNAEGALPVEQLEAMAAGDYSVGDLALLLENAGHTAGIEVDDQTVADATQAAAAAGANGGQLDVQQLAGIVSRVVG